MRRCWRHLQHDERVEIGLTGTCRALDHTTREIEAVEVGTKDSPALLAQCRNDRRVWGPHPIKRDLRQDEPMAVQSTSRAMWYLNHGRSIHRLGWRQRAVVFTRLKTELVDGTCPRVRRRLARQEGRSACRKTTSCKF